MYCGSYFQDKDGNKDDDLYIAYNMHWNPHELALPSLPEQKVWYLTADTNTPEVFLTEENQKKVSAKTVIVPPRSIIILTGKQETGVPITPSAKTPACQNPGCTIKGATNIILNTGLITVSIVTPSSKASQCRAATSPR